ncbi:hypothetical protein Esti_004586 [Eimeria stiedai]
MLQDRTDHSRLLMPQDSVQSRRESLILTRRLSNDGDLPRASSNPPVLCGNSSEETPDESKWTSQQTSLSASKAKRARVEAGAEPSGPSSPVDEDESTSESDGDHPSTSEGRQCKRRAGKLHSGPALVKGEHQIALGEVPDPPGRNEEELEAASALLALQESFEILVEPAKPPPEPTSEGAPPSAPPMSGHIGRDPQDSLSSSDEEAWSTSSSGLVPAFFVRSNLHDARRAAAGEQLTTSSAVFMPAGVEPSSNQSTDAGLGGGPPSTSSAEEGPDRPTTKGEHPFFRLPIVDPRDQRRRRFNPEAATSFGLAFSRSPARLHAIRGLLLFPRLTDAQLDELAEQLQMLVAYGCFYEATSVVGLHGSKAVYVLGRRYLVLDYVLCALEVLGEPPAGPWWSRFTAAINHDLEDDTGRSRGYRPLWKFNRTLAKKLSLALQILKSGHRLNRQETIELKQLLFCSSFSPSKFRARIWDAWRQDDKEQSESS